MVFGQPQFLPLLFLALIPLLVHLLALRQRRSIPFSMTKFLQEVTYQTQGRRWLREIVLLLLRTGAVLFALMTLTRPYAPLPLPLPPAPTAVAIVLDNSLSLQSKDLAGSGIWFNRAVKLCEQAIRQLPVEIAIFTADSPFKPIGDFGDDRSRLLSSLRQIRPTFKALDLNAALQSADISLSNRPAAVKRIAVLTDLQSEPFRSLKFPKLQNPIVVMDVKPKGQFGNARLAAKLLLPLDPNKSGKIVAELHNMSSQPMKGNVRVEVAGKNLARIEVSLKPDERKIVPFSLPAWVLDASDKLGLVRLTFRWESGIDILEWDDFVEFVFKSPKKLKVVNLVGEGRQYVDAALKAVGIMPATTQRSFGTTLKAETQLLDSDVIIASAPLELMSAQLMASWIRRGGSEVLVVDNALSPLWSMLGVSVQIRQGGHRERVQWVDENSPILNGLGASLQTLTTQLFANVKSTHTFLEALVTLTDGTPLLAELKVGQGRCFLLSIPLNPRHSNFVHSYAFVPLIHRLVRFCAYGHELNPKEADMKPQGRPNFSTVVPKSESDFRLPFKDEVVEKLKELGGTVASSDQFPHILLSEARLRDLTVLCLSLALICLLTESILTLLWWRKSR